MTVPCKRKEERMLECVVGCDSFSGLVDEQLLDEIKELFVLTVRCQHVALQGTKYINSVEIGANYSLTTDTTTRRISMIYTTLPLLI